MALQLHLTAPTHATTPNLSELELPPPIQLAFPNGKDHLQSFTITFRPDEGPYQGGAFLFAFSIPESYPHDPPRVFHPSMDSEGHVDLSTLCEDWKPENTIKTVVFGLNRLFLLPHTEDPLNHHAAEMLAQDPAGFQALVQQSVHSGATIGGQWFPPATGDRTIAPKAGLAAWAKAKKGARSDATELSRAEAPSSVVAPNEDDGDDMQYGKDPPGHRAGFVAIIGRPNAGKSTLLNALLGQQLSIVTQKAQTTRHKILGILSAPGYQAVFLDTPGIIEDKRNPLEERMMKSVQESLREADAVLAVVDAAARPQADLAMLQPGTEWSGPPMTVLLNKMDLLSPEQRGALEAWFAANCTAERTIPISALNATNTAAVVDWVVSKLPEGPSMYPKEYIAEANTRFFVSEIIRRHIFLQYQQEIPYSCAVEVVDYKERGKTSKDFIEAHIIVEFDRQRGILLGAGGAAIKALAVAAREEIEGFVGKPVFLQLSVKVQKRWRKDPALLERLGY
ncbi:hypothetical protein N2152v2_001388 [Parachlorella kessleri]